ncbi:MAG: FxsA family protein, partial [Gammaproteobacteria bacterium]
ITPGFITDTIGFLCLIPASRQAIIRYILARSSVQTGFGGQSASWQSKQSHQHQHQQKPESESPETKQPKVGRTIEGEYRRED